MNGKKAKRLRRQAREGRLAREATALAWEWRSGDLWGQVARYGEPYLYWDGETYYRRPDDVERYAFNVYDGDELVGSSVVEVHQYGEAVTPLLHGIRRANEENLWAGQPLDVIGPCYRPLNGDGTIAVMTSMAIKPGKSPNIFFALLVPIKGLGLPTFGMVRNPAILPLLRRWPVLR